MENYTSHELINLSNEIPLEEVFGGSFDFSKPDQFGIFALNPACRGLRTEVVRFLLYKGANVNSLSSDGYTPLLSTIESSHINIAAALELIDLLLNFGADIEMRGDWDKTPFLKSCTRGSIDVASLLIYRGCDIHAQAREIGGQLVDAKYLADIPTNTPEFKRYIAGLFGESH